MVFWVQGLLMALQAIGKAMGQAASKVGPALGKAAQGAGKAAQSAGSQIGQAAQSAGSFMGRGLQGARQAMGTGGAASRVGLGQGSQLPASLYAPTSSMASATAPASTGAIGSASGTNLAQIAASRMGGGGGASRPAPQSMGQRMNSLMEKIDPVSMLQSQIQAGPKEMAMYQEPQRDGEIPELPPPAAIARARGFDKNDPWWWAYRRAR